MFLHRARRERAALKKAKAHKAGWLGRLLPSDERMLTPDQEVDDYLKQEGVEHVSNSLPEDSKAAFELEKDRMSRVWRRREQETQESRCRQSRMGMLHTASGSASEPQPARNSSRRPPHQPALATHAEL